MDLRPSALLGNVTKILELGSHLNTVADVFGVFRGIPPSEKAPAAVRGLYGIFGQADERAFAVLLDDLEVRRPGSRKVLTGFFEWHAPKRTVVQSAVSWYYSNQFRAFLGKMGKSEGRVEGKKNHTTTYTDKDGKNHKEEVVTELRRSGDDNALDFLETMVQTIDPEGRVAPDPANPPMAPKRATQLYLEQGYERLLQQFIAFGYPHVPEGLAEKIEKIFGKTPMLGAAGHAATLKALTSLADKAVREAEEKKKKQGWFTRLLQKI